MTMKFLQTVLIILLVFFALRIIFRLAAPYIMRFVAKKAGERFEQMGKDFQNRNQQPQSEGETVIDRVPKNQKTSNKKVGEYIDYEEID